jgi:Pretoxin HINT domain
MRAAHLPSNSNERKQLLDEAEEYLVEWFMQGQSEGFSAMGRTVDAEVHSMARDPDLALVRLERKDTLQNSIPKQHWPIPGGGTGCVPLGTFIDTPNGRCRVERLRPGDEVLSLSRGSAKQRVRATIVSVGSGPTKRCIRLNRSWLVTPTQPVRLQTGWVEAAELKRGDRVMNGYGVYVPILELKIVERRFQVFDLTIDNPCHNYVANGLLCHNKKA